MKKKELHILYIITKLELGGAQKICLSLFNEVEKSGNKTLLISGKSGILVNSLANNSTVYLLDSLKREISLLSIWQEIKNFFKLITLIRTLKKEHPHLIVHTHSTKAGLLGRWAALCAGVKTRIHTVHGFGFHPYQNKIGWFINYVLEFFTSYITSHYICVSSYDVKTGLRLLPTFKNKYSIIRASVEEKKFSAAQATSLNEKNFIFGTIACFKKQKNLFDLLNAFKKCYEKNNKVKLEVIGDGHLRPAIETWITKNNLNNAITLLGWQNNVAAYMAHWNTFVLSSLWEGLPCAIVEARLLKLPVISYNTGGINDIIIHEENGLLSKPKNWDCLAQNMIKISTNTILYAKLAAFNDNLEDFQLQKMIDDHITLYKQF